MGWVGVGVQHTTTHRFRVDLQEYRQHMIVPYVDSSLSPDRPSPGSVPVAGPEGI